MLHRTAVLGDRHAVANWQIADAAALAGLSPVTADIGKLAWQTDDALLHYLVSVGPAVWVVLNPPAEDPPETHSIPPGGTTGQILAKISGTDYDVQWIDAPTGGGGEEEMAESFGVWTPVVGEFNADVLATMDFAEGTYHRIGDRVFCEARMRGAFDGVASGDVYIDGAPFEGVVDGVNPNVNPAITFGQTDTTLAGVVNAVELQAFLSPQPAAIPKIIMCFNNASGDFGISAADLDTDTFTWTISFNYRAIPL